MTDEQRYILSMVLLNPDEWEKNAVKVLGKEEAAKALTAKVEAYRPLYDKAIIDGTYKTAEAKESEKGAENLALNEKLNQEYAKKIEIELVISTKLPSLKTFTDSLDKLATDTDSAKSIAATTTVLKELIGKVKDLTEVVCKLAKVE